MKRFAFALGLVLAASSAAAHAAAGGDVARGRYLATTMDCGGCHTPGYLLGKPDMTRYVGGGNVGFQIPGAGIFYPPNLTPDNETGLGKWSKADIIKAITKGERPDGRILVGIMPWRSYGKLTPKDADSLVSYLQSLKPISNKVPAISGPKDKAPGLYMTVAGP